MVAAAPVIHHAPRVAYVPAAAPAPQMAAATQGHSNFGLRSLGGKPGDAFLLAVRPSTGTVEAVSPVSQPDFSFTLPYRDNSVRGHWQGSGRVPLPLDRTAEGFHHLGDVTLRVRPHGSKGGYATHSTVSKTPPLATAGETALHVSDDGKVAELDATACLKPPVAKLRLTRKVEVDGPEVRISLTLINDDPTVGLEIGGLGLSMPMNQMFSGRSLPEVAKRCSFTEVYVGGDAGYVQVTRTTGEGPVLLALPLNPPSPPSRDDGNADAGRAVSGAFDGGGGGGHAARQRDGTAWRGFEGWRPLKWEDRANYDWMHEMLCACLPRRIAPPPCSSCSCCHPTAPAPLQRSPFRAPRLI